MRELNLSNIKQTIGFYPHAMQREILKNQERFTVVVGGKRVGKTILAAYLALRELFGVERKIWIIAPTIDLTGRIWEYLSLWIDKYYSDLFSVNKQMKIIENKLTRSKLWAKTGENEAGLLGEGLDLAIIDEASRMKSALWKGYIEPNLMDREGRAFFISNPFGFNWFYDLYQFGLPENRKKYPDYISFVLPTAVEDSTGKLIGTNNPTIKLSELADKKRTTPPDIWRQEYMAVFQEGAGQRFKNFESCIDDSIEIKDESKWFEPPQTGHLYLFGVDLGKVEDFTVMTIIDRMTNRVVGFWRINRVDWEFIKIKIKQYAEAYNNAIVTVDATGGASDVFTEDLSNMGVFVNEFKYTGNKKKNMLIDRLAMFLEAGKIKFPRIPDLVNEIRSFTYHFTSTKVLIYGSSKHDDCVNSLAMACWDLNEEPLSTEDGKTIWRPMLRDFK